MELKTRDKIIVVVLVIVALAVFFGGRYRDNHTHFTTEKWVSAVGNDRQKIVQNLLDRTVFPGMTEAEVKELLGEPEEEAERHGLCQWQGPAGGLHRRGDTGQLRPLCCTRWLLFHDGG